ncbi:post-transcriptional regulator [Alteribacillus iranensis]|uniref:Post-transcriptional regulator n=1 Tax=Alteribacillus iranensis TaxID=930128 RepID=A0A1I1Z6C4_9BACI|nr:post-transcriptional regulator [Alteribacillus iranensis]SFE27275.1 Post-transcriptional regulator [Alteribacillus iranensis]
MAEQQFEVWKEEADPALQSKLDEFELLGYTKADKEEIWKFTVEKIKKKETPVRLHELINEILKIRLNEYMNKITIASYKDSARLSEKSDLDDLIGEIDTHVSNKRHLT